MGVVMPTNHLKRRKKNDSNLVKSKRSNVIVLPNQDSQFDGARQMPSPSMSLEL
jgi:hypothetical protein